MAKKGGDVIFRLLAEDSGLKKGINSAKTSISGLSKWMGSIPGLSSIGGGLLTGGALVAGIRNWANLGDEIQKVAQRTGVTADEWSRLRYAAQLMDTDIVELETNFRFMTKTIQTGSEKAATALGALGLSMKDLQAMTPFQQFMAILSALEGVENVSQRVALSMQVFGKIGTNTLNLIADGTGELNRVMRETPEVFSEDEANSAARLNDNITIAEERVKSLFGTLVGYPLSSAFNAVFDQIVAAWDALPTALWAMMGYYQSDTRSQDIWQTGAVNERMAKLRNARAKAEAGPLAPDTSLSSPAQQDEVAQADEFRRASAGHRAGMGGWKSPLFEDAEKWLKAGTPTAAEMKAQAQAMSVERFNSAINAIQRKQAAQAQGPGWADEVEAGQPVDMTGLGPLYGPSPPPRQGRNTIRLGPIQGPRRPLRRSRRDPGDMTGLGPLYGPAPPGGTINYYNISVANGNFTYTDEDRAQIYRQNANMPGVP